ncbi:prepilin-type N-terminal cleavage/methylation domain-containing protein [Victivallis vadensis]|uniref:prepilin-type N-terminal cleavage/methylation domain-containing protein n=1 Tax=Victivallis vadensis TaxID=172901 RepID=UPI0023F01073|nr:prepilin-type N-terminal cleavage/methylation domain-containing protein [Victivallis vadensis]
MHSSIHFRNFRRNSFTLIELLVVIAIIAIVVASKVGFFLQFSAIFAFKAL